MMNGKAYNYETSWADEWDYSNPARTKLFMIIRRRRRRRVMAPNSPPASWTSLKKAKQQPQPTTGNKKESERRSLPSLPLVYTASNSSTPKAPLINLHICN